MIRITRDPLPEDLTSQLTTLTRKIGAIVGEGQAAQAHRIWELKSTRTKVRARLYYILGQMAPGREQCMYCGETGNVIDHFEPISRNPLRTFEWLNHILACTICNSSKKRDQFPLDLDGKPLLVDPTAEDPFDHLLLTLSTGIYVPRTRKGQVTIEVCDLNRRLLTEGRLHARLAVETFLLGWATAYARSDVDWMTRYVWLTQGQPFADVCQAMLRQAMMPGAEIVFRDSPQILRILRLDDLRQTLLSLQ